MKYRMNGIGRSPQVAASILICGLLLAGCDDRVTVIRDSNIPIAKGSTWTWKPSRTTQGRGAASRCIA